MSENEIKLWEKKDKSRVRNQTVRLRLSPEEKIKFLSKVAKSGMTQQEYLLSCAMDKEIKIIGTKEQLDQLIFEINKIGVNLNQVARRLNEGNYFGAEKELEQIKERYSESLDTMIEILEKVRK